ARRTDASGSPAIIRRAARQPVQPAVRREERVGHCQRVTAARSVADDEREEFVVAERRDAMTAQLLSRPILRQQVLHLTPSLSRPVRPGPHAGVANAGGILDACGVFVTRSCPSRWQPRRPARRAPILPTRNCSRRRGRSTPPVPPAPISTRTTSSP